LIAEEVALLTRLPLNTVTPRIAPLVRKGYIIPIGKRKSSSGRNQRVHKWISDQ
jgi:Fic family protein